jgi:hypothetical protein
MFEALIWILIILLGFCAVVAYFAFTASPDKLNEKLYGKRSRDIICSQCCHKGQVHTKPITKKAGVSGGKATAALLTGGASLLAVGLSRKESMTEAHCCKCESNWHF